ncbi:hypothetical protein D9619_012698 [Psilocybe cf. subviscida]|uniref:Uncharacterized protein n=1 Tax=Psilocybe cf. subviscida TaxID=2480587 RepID=A0A8H5AQK9_9AGAR|nr:hypothetical protein D9619_012698 [Psilocybe cf. subviscida]
MLALNFALVALATAVSVVQASPTLTARQSDNGYCSQLLTICAAAPNTLTNPWSSKACIFGATCFGGQRPVDGFLSALAGAKNTSSALASVNAPRVSQSVFDSISTNGQVITQQNYIDGVFGTLATTNGPFPDASFVINDYQRVTVWTAFCNGQGVPFKNFADYYQFSATVSSPGCASTTTTQPPPSSSPTSVSSDASCNKMFNTCVAQANSAVSDAWSHPACLYAASCFGGQRPVDGLLATVFGAKGGSGTAPVSVSETRLSTATMKTISTDGSTITQQNFIDGYFGLLSSLGGPFPDASVVISYFSRIQAWTGFCTGGIPFMNFADYFQFSASVSSSTSC